MYARMRAVPANRNRGCISETQKPKMKDKLVDDYITAFNSLAVKAGWELSNEGTIDAFCSGLHPGTLNAIMNRETWPKTMTQWQQAARDKLHKYLAKKVILTF
jgi:hypothetical protein